MTQTLSELIDRSFTIKCYLEVSSYLLHQYEDGSYSDFHVDKLMDLPTLIRLAGGLKIKIFHDTNYIIVRLFERE